MINSKFIKIIKAFSSEEKRLLRKYINDKQFSEDFPLKKLVEYGLKNTGNTKKINNKQAFDSIFGLSRAYDEKKYRYLLADGVKLLESFLVQHELNGDQSLQYLLLAKSFRRLELDREWGNVLKKANVALENSPFRNRTYHYYKHEFQKEILQKRLDDKRQQTQHSSATSNHLNPFFIIESLMMENARLNFEIYNPDQSAPAIINERLLNALISKQSTIPPAVAVYQKVHALLKEPDEVNHYSDLKGTFFKWWKVFPRRESKDILISIINYCIRKINQRNLEFLNECLDLYQWGLENAVLLENGYLSSFDYKNIITLCLHATQDDELAMTILNKHKDQLAPQNSENIYAYNLARIHFFNKSYKETVAILQAIKYNDLLNELDGRRMLLRIYFEEKEWVVLDSFLLSFTAFINRQKSLGYHKDYYLNLVRYVKKALKFPNFNANKKQQFIEEIKAASQLNDKTWLVTELQKMI